MTWESDPQIPVAEELSVARDYAPHKRHQGLPTLSPGGAPVSLTSELCTLLRLAWHIGAERFKEFRVGAAKHFLPAHTIDHDKNDVLRLMFGRGLRSSNRNQRCGSM